jgi:hypothetical protein
MLVLKLLFILLLFSPIPAEAQDWFDEPKRNDAVEDTDKGLITFAPTVRVMVPTDSALRGNTLRVDGISYPINSFIDLPGVYSQEDIEIEVVAEDGRILDYQYRTVEETMLRDFKIRSAQFRLGFGIRATDNEKWDQYGLTPSGTILDFAFHYFPGKWGVRFGMLRLKRSGSDKDDRLTEYEVTEIPLLIGYDIVPFRDSMNWRQWHLRLWLGLVSANHRLKTHFDRVVSDESGSTAIVNEGQTLTQKTNGLHLGFELMKPLTDRVWLTLEYGLIHRSLEFKDADFLTEKPINDFKIGLYFSI